MNNQIDVTVSYLDNKVIVSSQNDIITIHTTSDIPINEYRQDFAVWLFLPIAMRSNSNLHINGSGTNITIKNAIKMSQIWSSWMPNHLSDIKISFSNIVDPKQTNYTEDDICFYSGGVDSTYCIGQKVENQNLNKLTLLTVHGMDYNLDDEEKFNKFIDKIKPFASFYGSKHLLIKTDAYQIYSKYKVNTKISHIGHIFALAGCGFLYSGYYKNIIIAADYRLDQQFLVSPWGSNSATNFLFDDGITSLITKNDDIARSEKLEWIASSNIALESSTFCSEKKNRPNNCGVCSKCTRTKLMFLAATGSIPNIFLDMKIHKNAPILKVSTKSSKNTFLLDLYFCAKNNNRLDLIPGLEKSINRIKKLDRFGLLK